MKQKPTFRRSPTEKDDVRTRVDLREWTGSPPFHLDKRPFGYRMSDECKADLDLIDRYSSKRLRT